MTRKLTPKSVSKILISIFTLILLFHFLVLFGFIPFNIVWGGRINSESEMILFESISIGINLLMIGLVLTYSQIIKNKIPIKILRAGIWAMAVLFAVNTLGNMLSMNDFEKWFFTPQTFILSILCIWLALKNQPSQE